MKMGYILKHEQQIFHIIQWGSVVYGPSEIRLPTGQMVCVLPT